MVISEKLASNIFGNADPVGKTITVTNRDEDYTISAVMKDIPENSHFHFDILASTLGYANAKKTTWMQSDFFTYLVLKKDADIAEVEAKLPAITKKYMGPQMIDAIGMSYEEFQKDNELGLFLQPLTDIHLHSDFSDATTLEQGGDIKYVYIFSIVAIFMLVIACINFMNLATASASKRSKEVGIRKVLGSNKKTAYLPVFGRSFYFHRFGNYSCHHDLCDFSSGIQSAGWKKHRIHFSFKTDLYPVLIRIDLIDHCSGGWLSGILPVFLQSFKRLEIQIFRQRKEFRDSWRTRGFPVCDFRWTYSFHARGERADELYSE